MIDKNFWSGEITKHSFALDLEEGVFTWKDPVKIATSLKRSAEVSTRRKGTPFQSAMSMLNFYINRAGKNLNPVQKEILERAKIELRKLFGKYNYYSTNVSAVPFLSARPVRPIR